MSGARAQKRRTNLRGFRRDSACGTQKGGLRRLGAASWARLGPGHPFAASERLRESSGLPLRDGRSLIRLAMPLDYAH